MALRCFLLLLFFFPSAGCYLLKSTANWSELGDYGPEKYKDMAIVVDEPGRPDSDPDKEAHLICVERIFERVLMNRNYNIVARNDAIQKILHEQNIQLMDLTTEEGVIIGNLANAQALMIVHIIEFESTPIAGRSDAGRNRFQNTICMAAKLCDLRDGRTLWVGDFTLKDESATSRPDIMLLNRAANDVAKTCSPRPWWWFLHH